MASTIPELIQKIENNIVDNNNALVAPEHVRNVLVEMANYFSNYLPYSSIRTIIKKSELDFEDGYYLIVTNGNPDPTTAGFSVSKMVDVSLCDAVYFDENTTVHFAWYDANGIYISGKQEEGIQIKPATAKYLRFSVHNDTATNFVLVTAGNSIDSSLLMEARVGAGGFPTILSAVEALGGGHVTPITIHLGEGIYDEELKLHNRKITFIGANKNKTVIIGHTGDYWHPPLEISGEIYFQNLTIKETAENISSPAMLAYSAHLDYAGEGVMEFFNCIFESKANACVGIGLHHQQILRFKYCDFIQTGNLGGIAFYIHNNVDPDNNTGQRLEVVGCSFRIFGTITTLIHIEDAAWTWQGNNLVDTDSEFLFINNTFYSSAGTAVASLIPSSFGAGKIAGNIKLSPMSRGNNIAALNY